MSLSQPSRPSISDLLEASQRAQRVAEALQGEIPPSLADQANYHRWAEAAVVATAAPTGPLAPFAEIEQKAVATAAAVVRLRHRADQTRAEDEGIGYAPRDHFAVGLRVYFAVLQGVFLSHGLSVSVVSPWGTCIKEYLYCPACAKDQRRREAELGNTLPLSHMHSATTRKVDGSVIDIKEIPAWDAATHRCDRCEPDAIEEAF